MDKTIQTTAWACLPREFKEEVKKMWEHENKKLVSIDAVTALNEIFGIHNLTSDAEGEDEMLYVSRKKVQKMYAHYDKICNDPNRPKDYIESVYEYADGVTLALDDLFGSKCLPDEPANEDNFATKEPKPAEPKFKRGDTVMVVGVEKYDGIVFPILDRRRSGQGWIYEINIHEWINEAWLEPYSEPEDLNKSPETCTDDCSSPGKEVSQMKPIESKVSVYLATKEEDEEFRMLLHEHGFTWNTGTSLISDSLWSSVLEMDKIHYVHPDKTVTYYGDRTSDTLTFSEFKRRYFGENVNLSQNIAQCDKQFNNILKDSFRGHNRLYIAAMAMQGILSNIDLFKKILETGMETLNGEGISFRAVAKASFLFADALIAEAEKGDKYGGD